MTTQAERDLLEEIRRAQEDQSLLDEIARAQGGGAPAQQGGGGVLEQAARIPGVGEALQGLSLADRYIFAPIFQPQAERFNLSSSRGVDGGIDPRLALSNIIGAATFGQYDPQQLAPGHFPQSERDATLQQLYQEHEGATGAPPGYFDRGEIQSGTSPLYTRFLAEAPLAAYAPLSSARYGQQALRGLGGRLGAAGLERGGALGMGQRGLGAGANIGAAGLTPAVLVENAIDAALRGVYRGGVGGAQAVRNFLRDAGSDQLIDPQVIGSPAAAPARDLSGMFPTPETFQPAFREEDIPLLRQLMTYQNEPAFTPPDPAFQPSELDQILGRFSQDPRYSPQASAIPPDDFTPAFTDDQLSTFQSDLPRRSGFDLPPRIATGSPEEARLWQIYYGIEDPVLRQEFLDRLARSVQTRDAQRRGLPPPPRGPAPQPETAAIPEAAPTLDTPQVEPATPALTPEPGVEAIPETAPEAPAQPEVPAGPPPTTVPGRRTRAFVPGRQPYNFEVELLDLDDPGLLVSNNPDTFQPNEAFPHELFQFRDRSTREMQDSTIEKRLHFDRDALLRDHENLIEGIPIVAERNGQLVTISGNGRLMTIGGEAGQPSYAKYREALSEHATKFGLSEEQLGQFNRPVLVRKVTDNLSDEDLKTMAQVANESPADVMGSAQQARLDATRLTDSMLEGFESGSSATLEEFLDQQGSRGLVQDFAFRLPSAERTQVISGTRLSQGGRQRLVNAIFARVFGDEGMEVVRIFFESVGENIPRIREGVSRVMPDLLAVNLRISNGSLPGNLDIAPDLARAMRTLRDLQGNTEMRIGRREMTITEKVDHYVNTAKLFPSEEEAMNDMLLLNLADASREGAVRLERVLRRYTARALSTPDVSAPTFPGMEVPPQSKLDILADAMRNPEGHQGPGPAYDVEPILARTQRDEPLPPITPAAPAAPIEAQAGLGEGFETNQSLEMTLGAGDADRVPLADPEQLKAAQERRERIAAGQQTMDDMVEDVVTDADTGKAIMESRREYTTEPVQKAQLEGQIQDTENRKTMALRLEKASRTIREGGAPKQQTPPPATDGWQDWLDLSDYRTGENLHTFLARRYDGRMAEQYAQLESTWYNRVLPLYKAAGLGRGAFTPENYDQVVAAVEGRVAVESLEPRFRALVPELKKLISEVEARKVRLVTWARSDPVAVKYLPGEVSDMPERIAKLNTEGAYFPHHWESVQPDVQPTQPAAWRPGSSFERHYTYEEARELGMRPAYNDPFFAVIMDSYDWEDFERNLLLMKQLDDTHEVFASGSNYDPTKYRVPKVGRPFESSINPETGASRYAYAVPNRIADTLEEELGRRHAWNVNVPEGLLRDLPIRAARFVGAARPGSQRVNMVTFMSRFLNAGKTAKFALAPMQIVDMQARLVTDQMGAALIQPRGAWRSLRDRDMALHNGLPILKTPQTLYSLFRDFLRPPETRKRMVLDLVNSDTPLYPSGFDADQKWSKISHRMMVQEGLASRDTQRFIETGMRENIIQAIREVGNELPGGIRQANTAIQFMREGMFDVYYRRIMHEVMESVEIPRQIRLHRDWTDRQVVAEAARVTNVKMSSHRPWQQTVGNPNLRFWIKAPFISFSEQQTWFARYFEAIPGLGNTSPQSFIGPIVGMMILGGVATEMFNLAFNQRPAPLESFIPFRRDNEAPLGWSYSGRFLRPYLPWPQGRGGRGWNLDLMGQADTPFRFLRPDDALLSRIGIVPRAFWNQLQGGTFFGEELNPLQRVSQFALDSMFPIGAESTVQALRDVVPGVGSVVAEAEGRLGTWPNLIQGFSGFNLTAETNAQLRERAARRLFQAGYDEIEPFQRSMISETLGDELRQSAAVSARRQNSWGLYQNGMYGIDDARVELYHNLKALMQQVGNPTTTKEAILDNYFNEKTERRAGKQALRREHQTEDPEREPRDENEALLDSYYDLIDQATFRQDPESTTGGVFIGDVYNRAHDQFMAQLTPEQQQYVLRNTNFSPIFDEELDDLRMFLRVHAPNEYRRLMLSEQARQAHLDSLGR